MIKSLFTRLVREEEAAAASEYAILVAVIAVVVFAAVKAFNLGGIFTAAAAKVTTCVNATGTSC
jgi:Flp pilus assembly pilin Flp